MLPLSELQIAYLAGLVDGEGSLECQKQTQKGGATPRYVLRLSFCFATVEPGRTVAEWLGLKQNRYPSTDPKRSDRYRLAIPKGIAEPLLRRLEPHLILKREQARLILAIEATRAGATPSRSIPMGTARRMPARAIDEMEDMHLRLRAMKSNKRPGSRGWPLETA